MHPKPFSCCSFFVINFLFLVTGVLGVLFSSFYLMKLSPFIPALMVPLIIALLLICWATFGLCGASYSPDERPRRITCLSLSVAISFLSTVAALIIGGIPIFFPYVRDDVLPALWDQFLVFLNKMASSGAGNWIIELLRDPKTIVGVSGGAGLLLLLHLLFGWRLMGMKRFINVCSCCHRLSF